MSGIAEFLNARLAEDEAAAREAATDDQAQWVATDLEPAVYVADSNMPVAVGPWGGPMDQADAEHIVRHDPARVLRDIAAKRAVIAMTFGYEAKIDGEWACCHTTDEIARGSCPAAPPDEIGTLRALAAIWNDHPDYDPSWAAPSPTEEGRP